MKTKSAVFTIAVLIFIGSTAHDAYALEQGIQACAKSIPAAVQIYDGEATITNQNTTKSLRVSYTYNVYCNNAPNYCSCGATSTVDLVPSGSTTLRCALPCGDCDPDHYCTDVTISAQITAWRTGTSGAWQDAIGGSCSIGPVGSCLGPTCCSANLQIGD